MTLDGVARAALRLDRALGRHAKLLLGVELLCAVVILGACIRCFWPTLRGMATTSLWNDELFTIRAFSSQGPWQVVTDYHVPNNHIFFNLVNSLTPDSGSVLPLRARFWSFAAVVSSAGALLHHFWKRRRVVEGAVACTALLGSEGLTDLALQARGYGFLCLASVVLVLAVARLAETDARRELTVIAVACVLGTYTVPTFLFFAVFVLLGLWAQRRTRAELACGLGVMLGVGALYAPLAKSMAAQLEGYAGAWGEQYAELSAVQQTLSEFMWSELAPWGVLLVMLGSLLLPHYVADVPLAKCVRLLAPAVWLTFGLFLVQRTPLVRTTSFVVVPLAFVLVAAGSAWLRRAGHVVTVLAQLGAAWATLLVLVPRIEEYEFRPIESWLEVARFVESHFPPGTRVAAPFRGQYLDAYLDDAYPVEAEIDERAFRSGDQLFLDGTFFERKTFDGTALEPTAERHWIVQRRGAGQALWWVPKR